MLFDIWKHKRQKLHLKELKTKEEDLIALEGAELFLEDSLENLDVVPYLTKDEYKMQKRFLSKRLDSVKESKNACLSSVKYLNEVINEGGYKE